VSGSANITSGNVLTSGNAAGTICLANGGGTPSTPLLIIQGGAISNNSETGVAVYSESTGGISMTTGWVFTTGDKATSIGINAAGGLTITGGSVTAKEGVSTAFAIMVSGGITPAPTVTINPSANIKGKVQGVP